ncbi:hypothetical protein ENSA5_64300 [Enhygromyxa salina]|uniref:Endo-1,4-beta-xylanase A n=1 Tax=Enhygromyxa salina TaxID=215803 RepID=A0A2S9XCD3_9BACT|nr:hypothetical protein [Enhygromyxa salina]PRP90515.1 hypothetical protein ENSA5_64300 [Enhygromyxa salina]
MFKNLSFLALAGTMTLAASMTTGCILSVGDDTLSTGDGDGDGDGDTTGDGDDTTGDGDDTTGDGDGDPGDGDGDPGDGDGDDTTGDGDGDGDGDTGALCGWVSDVDPVGYYCGGEGEDPDGVNPIGCPEGLVDGDPCPEGLTGAGCCDADGNNWYCGTVDDTDITVLELCG